MRQCQVCGSSSKEFIHRQAFARPQDDTQTHYDVVVCKDCGFAFADNIPSQAAQDEYYAESAHHAHAQQLPAGLSKIHREFFDFIAASVPLNPGTTNVLDIGSSMGHFLNLFKQAGFTDIQGLDPSPGVDKLAWDAYGLQVSPVPLGNFAPSRSFELVTLCGVLEHIVELQEWLDQATRLIRPGSHIFVAVPDAARFGDAPPREPFLEFAHEHINFFTPQSLGNLLTPRGFVPVREESRWNDFYGNHYVLAVYRYDGNAQAPNLPVDEAGLLSLKKYVANSNARQALIEQAIEPVVARGTPIAVWGTGALASRLCATTCLRKANIVTFLDSNPQVQGRSFLGRPIAPPGALKSTKAEAVLIASYVYSDEISRILREEMHWPGGIISLP